MLGARIASPHILRGEKAKCRSGTTPRGEEENRKERCERERRRRERDRQRERERERERERKKNTSELLHLDLLGLSLSQTLFFLTQRPSFFSLFLPYTHSEKKKGGALILEKNSDKEEGQREKERERESQLPLSLSSLSLHCSLSHPKKSRLEGRLGEKHTLFSLSISPAMVMKSTHSKGNFLFVCLFFVLVVVVVVAVVEPRRRIKEKRKEQEKRDERTKKRFRPLLSPLSLSSPPSLSLSLQPFLLILSLSLSP